MRALRLLTAIMVIAPSCSLFIASTARAEGGATLPPVAAPVAAPVSSYPVIDSQGGGAIPALPLDTYTSHGINFINGGIGDEELSLLKSKEAEFNLHVMLSAPRGEFISDVTLRLLDAKDTPLLAISDAGPYFYARLAPGSYTLETTSVKGEKKLHKLTVTEKNSLKHHITYSE
jgi:hypothetical protein